MTRTPARDAELADLRRALLRYQRQQRRVAKAPAVSMTPQNENGADVRAHEAG